MCFLIYTSIKCDGGDGMVHYILVLMWVMGWIRFGDSVNWFI